MGEPMGPAELDDWQRLVAFLPVLSEEDSVTWPHSSSGKFSVKSLYSRLSSGSPTSRFKPIWDARIPPKIKFSCDKRLGVGSPQRIRFVNAMGRAQIDVRCALL